MKFIFDKFLSVFLIFIILIPMLLISIIIKLSSKGPVLFWSDRVGENNRLFRMPKFRSMNTNTPLVATEHLENTNSHIYPFGRFLRLSSLDELPQLFSILKGDMSFVGPRPALFNQYDLISLRTKKDIHFLRPGLTGLAQVNGRDNISMTRKVILDERYLFERSMWLDFKILCITFYKVIMFEGISH